MLALFHLFRGQPVTVRAAPPGSVTGRNTALVAGGRADPLKATSASGSPVGFATARPAGPHPVATRGKEPPIDAASLRDPLMLSAGFVAARRSSCQSDSSSTAGGPPWRYPTMALAAETQPAWMVLLVPSKAGSLSPLKAVPPTVWQ